jgi:hypothetical protein
MAVKFHYDLNIKSEMKLSFFYLVVLCAFFFGRCSNSSIENPAQYTGNPKNGLIKEQIVDSNKVWCQLIPDKREEGQANGENYRFRVYIKCPPEASTDSVLYNFNYGSDQLFNLVVAKDTLYPVLSERVANGRRDMHEFTVVFNSAHHEKESDNLTLLVHKNDLITKDLFFEYRYNDLTKALKTLYGYDPI